MQSVLLSPIIMNILWQIRNYIGITVSTSVLDYIEQFPGATPPPPRANSSTIASSSLPTRRSTRIGSSTTHVVLRYTQNPLFPLCAITKFDITRSKITGMTESPAKRNVRPFFVSSNIIPSLEMEIEEHNGRIMVSPRSDSREPLFYILYDDEFYIDLYDWVAPPPQTWSLNTFWLQTLLVPFKKPRCTPLWNYIKVSWFRFAMASSILTTSTGLVSCLKTSMDRRSPNTWPI